MPVSSRAKRLVAGAVAIVAATLVHGSSSALAAPLPDYVKEISVPGSGASQIAHGLGASWVAGALHAGDNQIIKIDPTGAPTTYDMPANSARAEDLTVTSVLGVGDAVWASGTLIDSVDPLTPHAAMLFRLDPAATSPIVLVSHPGFDIVDVASDSAGNVWYAEVSSSGTQQLRIGGFDSAGTTVDLVAFPNVSADYLAPRPQDEGLWFIEKAGGITKIAKFDTTSHTITAEHDLGAENADSLITGPDDALWFRESFVTGATSITRMATTGPEVGIPQRHDLSGILPIGQPTDGTLAVADGGLWFTTGDAIGRMTPAGTVDKLLCVAPSHPNAIAPGPGSKALSFTELTDVVGRMSTEALGLPCPVPPLSGGGGGGGFKTTVLDKTPANVSLSGKATQRFTKRGTIVVTVRSDEACLVTGQASVSTPGASTLFRSNKASKNIGAGKPANLTLKFKKKAVKAIGRLLKKRKRLKARLTIAVTDGAGNKSTGKRTVKLKR